MMYASRSIFMLAALFGGLLFSSCEEIIDDIYKSPKGDSTLTIVETAQQNDDFSILVEALDRAGLVGALSDEGPFTVFAPNNHAFENLFAELGVADVNEIDSALLTDVLLYHVVGTKALSTDLTDGQSLETLLGASIDVHLEGDYVFVNDIKVVFPNVVASNGVIHVIEKVLVPPTDDEEPEDPDTDSTTIVDIARSDERFSILVEALIKADLAEALASDGPFTVFAPTNDAFNATFDSLGVSGLDDLSAEQIRPLLFYHVIGDTAVFASELSDGQQITTLVGQDVAVSISGDTIRINDAQVIVADIVASNGVIHAIDQVLIPSAPEEEPEDPGMDSTTVVDIAQSDERFSILVEALVKADLDEALAGDGPFTVFAPTNEAFEAAFETLGVNGVADLTKEQLAPILLYHVVGGVAALSEDLSDGQQVTTLTGEDVAVSIADDGLRINDAQVVVPDVVAGNGVVHAIDQVLIPSARGDS